MVFFWQMPHFYPLAMKYKDDYARAGIPMLPVVASVRRVNAEILIFAWLTVLTSLAVWPLGMSADLRRADAGGGRASSWSRRTGSAGGRRRGEAVKPMRLFHWSTTYLTILFAAVALDALI